jgi:hypothetical protein
MKKKTNILLLILITTTSAWSQSSMIKINADESNIHWLAKKVTGEHEGVIKLVEGSFHQH